MKVTREQAEANRERILDNAGRLFRERGFDGIGLNDLMQAAGLTRGGFYGHFESKDDLAAHATRQALASHHEAWRARSDRSLADWVEAYLSDAHRDGRGEGCGLAALAGDVARSGPPVQAAFAQGVRSIVAALQPQMPADDAERQREQALATLSTLVGALVLSRAVGDDALSRELRDAARQQLPLTG